ncbi:forkhead box O4 [Homo sapiens]|uniref:Isoform Zeta of Forkhead box protein O4 n=1 Tax=Homo sapiens TaxID=9606 RepID=P98177-2|nr:forkhead box protein O4 isoform 2 [Homo sapiens]EAX05321.1 myeloid/lymphoid or mixed-lineage leukemia (trithorax homolog, Drosophila); translocated to, 7, isoform CRA_a [Homo sapiens]KAI2599888.1 forkhead box O4 [Homo sapiens]KAI4000093.1 forkhead box O4 [Homo sapiens]|eukprot:NP_001164402.1 forkhead box protein O4 isoform 2 [Homo sapiens]
MDPGNENSATEAAAIIDLDPDFEPQSRPRSCTWPLPRPEIANQPSEPPEVEPDLGEKAIESAPEKRLTLAQIYEWMVRTVPYFKDKGDSNSSAGWKNSIRHNLSLHSKFIKVHNEATGKSSWWMLNPEGGKSGKAPRRRAASMDSSSKLLRGRSKAPKKKPSVLPAPPEGATPTSPVGHFAKWSGSPCSRNREEADMWTTFRPRSSSNASSVSTRLSPLRPESEVLAEEIPASVSSYAGGVPPTLNEGLELLDGLNLTSSHSLLSRSGLSGFSLQHPGVTGPLHTYSSSLFSPAEGPLSAGEGCFSSSQALEALLTSDTPPPPADVLMTQVDPILSQAPTLLLLGGLPSSSKLATGVGLCPKPLEAPGPSSLVPTLSMIAPPPVMASAPIPKALGTPVLTPPTEAASQDRMPQDLDLDMYMENLECDMDNIISDLMDEGEGLDFNFEPDP